MKIEYSVYKDDFLAFQLFFSSQSKRVKKSKTFSTFVLSLILIALSIISYLKGNLVLAIYFFVVAILSLLFFPYLYKKLLKRQLIKFCNENYKNIHLENTILEFDETSIYSKSKMGESRLNISEVEKIDEIEMYFYIKLSNALTLIVPKHQLKNVDELRTKLKSYGIEFNSLLDWKW